MLTSIWAQLYILMQSKLSLVLCKDFFCPIPSHCLACVLAFGLDLSHWTFELTWHWFLCNCGIFFQHSMPATISLLKISRCLLHVFVTTLAVVLHGEKETFVAYFSWTKCNFYHAYIFIKTWWSGGPSILPFSVSCIAIRSHYPLFDFLHSLIVTPFELL